MFLLSSDKGNVIPKTEHNLKVDAIDRKTDAEPKAIDEIASEESDIGFFHVARIYCLRFQ